MTKTSNTRTERHEGGDGYQPFAEGAPPVEVTGNGELTPEQEAHLRRKASELRVLSLGEIARMPIDKDKILLGKDRFLCVGGIGMLVAPTGVGKSTAVLDMAARWSLRKPSFGIEPQFALKILIVQAENDDGDMTEMTRDVYAQFTPKEQAQVDQRVHCTHITKWTAANFIVVLGELLKEFKPYLVIIDPLNAYTGCDPSDADSVTTFLRTWLNPLLEKHDCAALIVHHTPKTRSWDTSKWKPIDWVYAAAGNNDISNAVRAMIVIDPTDDPAIYRFIAAKRGTRIGWTDDLGEPVTMRVFKHAKKGRLLWTEATEQEVAEVHRQEKLKKAGRKRTYSTKSILKPLLENENGLKPQELLATLNTNGCPIKQSGLYNRLEEEKENGMVKVDKDGVYTLTDDGNALFTC
jgi:hypothetical protein